MNNYVLRLVLLLTSFTSPCTGDSSVDARRKESLSNGYEMREAPEFATVVGDYRYNGLWSDNSLAHVLQQRAELQKWLSRFEAIDRRASQNRRNSIRL